MNTNKHNLEKLEARENLEEHKLLDMNKSSFIKELVGYCLLS